MLPRPLATVVLAICSLTTVAFADSPSSDPACEMPSASRFRDGCSPWNLESVPSWILTLKCSAEKFVRTDRAREDRAVAPYLGRYKWVLVESVV